MIVSEKVATALSKNKPLDNPNEALDSNYKIKNHVLSNGVSGSNYEMVVLYSIRPVKHNDQIYVEITGIGHFDLDIDLKELTAKDLHDCFIAVCNEIERYAREKRQMFTNAIWIHPNLEVMTQAYKGLLDMIPR